MNLKTLRNFPRDSEEASFCISCARLVDNLSRTLCLLQRRVTSRKNYGFYRGQKAVPGHREMSALAQISTTNLFLNCTKNIELT